MAKFSKTEKELIGLLKEAKEEEFQIDFLGKKYRIVEVGKPTSSIGEPKTDIYILMSDDNDNIEIKISVKQSNADFLENKIKAERAEELFGEHWKEIIQASTSALEDNFESRTLIYRKKEKRTKKGAITLGWKFELLNKLGGELSEEIAVSAFEVYSGECLPIEKKDSYVDGRRKENSGVANYILVCPNDSRFENVQSILDSLIPIDEFVAHNPMIFFACKALNLRTMEKDGRGRSKWDGDRPLSVYVDWSIVNNKLHSEIIYDNPLHTKGNSVAENLLICLSQLEVEDTDGLTKENVDNCDICN